MTLPDANDRWLQQFLEKDYSWQGLKKKDIPGWKIASDYQLVFTPDSLLPDATLQDFWREEEKQLIDTPFGCFTRWHLPPGDFAVSRPRPDEVLAKLVSAAEIIRRDCRGEQTQAQIPFMGLGFEGTESVAIAMAFLSREPIAASLADAFIVEAVLLQDVVLPSFSGRGMTFLQDFACAEGMIETFSIDDATFLGDFSLVGMNFGKLEARRAKFLKKCWVERCRFTEHFDFGNASVADWCEFRACEFRKGASFRRCVIKAARWNSCSTVGGISLENAHITASLWTSQSNIANFDAHQLTCVGDFTLDRGVGTKWLRLNEARLSGKVSFHTPPTLETFEAVKTQFLGEADFPGLQATSAILSGAVFNGRTSFAGATFSGPVKFDDVTWPNDAAHYASAFRECRFTDASDFSTARFNVIAAFHEAHFARPPLIHLAEGKAGQLCLRQMIDQANAAARAGDHHGPIDKELLERHFGALEGGARVLKQAMEARRARGLEQRLYRYELIARRHRPSVGPWERSISWLFGLSSNYGDSSLRPLAILLGMTIAFGVAYALWASLVEETLNLSLIQQGLTFSGRSVFRPFDVWNSAKGSRDAVEAALLWNSGPGWGLVARVVSSTQSFLSLILTFLVALSLKRRFQLG
ncbi:MAG TPA: pentapeptide repeat-containing protein [Allosphingosinicella sp.]|nr:pentapeptide repeat-containing protein [Allosphingosinicella sp.]